MFIRAIRFAAGYHPPLHNHLKLKNISLKIGMHELPENLDNFLSLLKAAEN